jgi:seryl-tRNA synthetase
MTPTKRRMTRVTRVTASVVVSSCLAAAAYAQSNTVADKVGSVITEQVKAEEAAQSSQRKIAQLDDEATKMLSEYRMAIAESQSLKGYNDQLAAQVKSQNDEVETMTKQLSEIETTSKEVLPMMQKMVATLDQFVKLDMPFLPDERANRVAQLRDLMTRADVSVSEKYRRIVEAYQIEIEYGRTLEAYQGKVDDKTVDFLRAGRISLMYQTLDGKETGYWDRAAKKWVVDSAYGDVITAGLKVAKKQAAPDFITVAVPAPKEIS